MKPVISNVLKSLAKEKNQEIENSIAVSTSLNSSNATDEKVDESSSYVCAVPLLMQCK